MKAEEVIRKIKFAKSDLDFAALNGAFNGRLLIDIRNAMQDYARIQIEKDRERVRQALTELPGSGASQYVMSTVSINLD